MNDVADELVREHGWKLIGWLTAAFGVVVAWVGRRAERRFDDHEARLQALERTVATREDIEKLRSELTAAAISITTEINEARAAAEEKHREILMLLASWKAAPP